MPYKTLQEQFMGNSDWLLPYFLDEEVTDIFINGTKTNYIEKAGQLSPLPKFFTSLELEDFIERLLLPEAKRLDRLTPALDGCLIDGSRYHVIHSPITEETCVSIRKHAKKKDFEWHSIWVEWLKEQVKLKKNILIAGATGAGKTSLVSYLLKEIAPHERLIVLEECKELPIQHPHTIQMETRLAIVDGAAAEVTLRTLVKNALRMRPDRIVLGECRGIEAFDVIQALSTGHKGSLATIHASSALDALKRLEALVALGASNIPLFVIKSWISTSVQVVVYLEKEGNSRKIKEIVSLEGLEGEQYRVLPKLYESPLVNQTNLCDFNELFKESFYERRHSS